MGFKNGPKKMTSFVNAPYVPTDVGSYRCKNGFLYGDLGLTPMYVYVCLIRHNVIFEKCVKDCFSLTVCNNQ